MSASHEVSWVDVDSGDRDGWGREVERVVEESDVVDVEDLADGPEMEERRRDLSPMVWGEVGLVGDGGLGS